MAIIFNIFDGGAPRNSEGQATPLDAGASIALAPSGGADPATQTHSADTVFDGGAPSVTLVETINAALHVAEAVTSDASLSADGMNGGPAPV